MGEFAGASPSMPYEVRIEKLKSAGIALWDVLASCTRYGSLDADIKTDSIFPNDFATFFSKHPHITNVYFNGAMAEKCFRKYVLPSLTNQKLHFLILVNVGMGG